jgi:AcrR family transcriptional regulator
MTVVMLGDGPTARAGGDGASTRGRPRSGRAQEAILAAAADLLLELGLHGMSMDAVADRAGVSKATIYRRWGSKELLALDVLIAAWRQRAIDAGGPDTGSLREDLFARVLLWARVEQRAFARALAGLVAIAQCDPVFAELYVDRLVRPRQDAARPLFRRAIERGEIPRDTDVDAALDLLYGPIYNRLLNGHAPVDEPFIRQVVDSLADALRSRV